MTRNVVSTGNDRFMLEHIADKLYAVVTVNGFVQSFDVTEYFSDDNPHDDWLYYGLMIGRHNDEPEYSLDEVVKGLDLSESEILKVVEQLDREDDQ